MGAINKPIVIVTEALVDVQQGYCVPSLIMSITSTNLKDLTISIQCLIVSLIHCYTYIVNKKHQHHYSRTADSFSLHPLPPYAVL